MVPGSRYLKECRGIAEGTVVMRFRSVQIAAMAILLLAVSSCGGVEVPDAVGENVDYARGLLIGAGLEVSVEEDEQVDVPEGQVMSQTPAAGAKAREGDTVTLRVAVSPEFSLKGEFTLLDFDGWSGDPCSGDGGYDDIRAGLHVTVRDQTGTVLGTGALEGGTPLTAWCTFTFTVDALPKADFYSVEVGRRGELTYSFEELESSEWTVYLSLGG